MPSMNSLLNSSIRFLASKLSLAVLCCLSFHWSGNQSVWNLSIELDMKVESRTKTCKRCYCSYGTFATQFELSMPISLKHSTT